MDKNESINESSTINNKKEGNETMKSKEIFDLVGEAMINMNLLERVYKCSVMDNKVEIHIIDISENKIFVHCLLTEELEYIFEMQFINERASYSYQYDEYF